MRRTVRLRESELRNMISETVKRVLRESDSYDLSGYDVSGYDDKKSKIFACLIQGDEEFARTLLDDLSDSAINEIFDVVRGMGFNC